MLSVPKWRPDRRITEQAPPEARRLYARYRALTWVGHAALNVMLLSIVVGFVSLVMDRDWFDTLLVVWFVTFAGSLSAYPAGEYYMNKLQREFPEAVLLKEEHAALAKSATADLKDGAAPHLAVEARSVRTSSDCHLLDDITRSGWPRPDEDSTVFSDDDLRIVTATCTCGRRYLQVWRRVPQSYFEYLVPVGALELSQIRSDIDSSLPNVTDKWITAERTVTALALTRPTIEYSPFPSEVLRWLPPGDLLAFTISPM